MESWLDKAPSQPVSRDKHYAEQGSTYKKCFESVPTQGRCNSLESDPDGAALHDTTARPSHNPSKGRERRQLDLLAKAGLRASQVAELRGSGGDASRVSKKRVTASSIVLPRSHIHP